ncbi:hypothetical protein GP486_000045 [Trichoglossum hirsutum]|uniref:Uncharacterized protein n=1 Tax=Trichoglossum hirsutum TaxID=265104 RepID=A0A9P8LJL8_9PEZI|nr:hypothetical protein GP486_000045 [Trichoglossum hirsutum]
MSLYILKRHILMQKPQFQSMITQFRIHLKELAKQLSTNFYPTFGQIIVTISSSTSLISKTAPELDFVYLRSYFRILPLYLKLENSRKQLDIGKA